MSVAYQHTCDYAVVFPRSPDLLSIIFFSLIVKLHEHIWVVWFCISKLDTSQVKLFVFVRRVIVFHIIFWLSINNILYKDVIINYEEMANWEDKFVLRSIKDNIVLSPSDYSKYESHMHNLSEDHMENNIHAMISDCNKLHAGLFSEYVFSNINKTRYHLVLKLISTVNNFANENGEKTKLLIIYKANSYFTCLNGWENEHYFTKTFSMLFPFRNGGYLIKRKTVISLQVWVE